MSKFTSLILVLLFVCVCSLNLAQDLNSPRLFHATKDGRAVEGGAFLKIRDNFQNRQLKLAHKENCVFSRLKLKKTCQWCSLLDPKFCIKGKSFILTLLGDKKKQQNTFTQHGTLDLLVMRPNSPKFPENMQKAEIDQVYASCNDLKSPVPFNEPGTLMVTGLPGDFFQFVSPRRKYRQNVTQSVVCTKPFDGIGINQFGVQQFVHYYLETLKLDKIFVYEVGATMGKILIDVIQDDPYLKMQLSNGRLELIDLRDELNRMYGPIYTDVLLFTSENGEGIVSSDCMTRAKSLNSDWILTPAWDEFLILGETFKTSSFSDLANRLLVQDSTASLELKVFTVNKTDHCQTCDSWLERSLNQFRTSPPDTNLQNKTKFIAHREEDKSIESWEHLFRSTSSNCLTTFNEIKVKEDDMFILRYPCLLLNRDVCDTLPHYVINWGYQLGSKINVETGVIERANPWEPKKSKSSNPQSNSLDLPNLRDEKSPEESVVLDNQLEKEEEIANNENGDGIEDTSEEGESSKNAEDELPEESDESLAAGPDSIKEGEVSSNPDDED